MADTLSGADLARILDEAVNGLQTNKKLVTDEVLLKAQTLLAEAKARPELLQTLLSMTRDQAIQFLASAEQGLGLEQRLVKTDLTDKLVAVMTRLKNRPLILKMIAALL